jgi:hypothetical protein
MHGDSYYSFRRNREDLTVVLISTFLNICIVCVFL